MCDNYTNKYEKPSPKYKKGDEVWFQLDWYNNGGTPMKCELRSDAMITLVKHKELQTNEYCIEYKYKSVFNEKSVHHTINEKDLYATEGDALQACFSYFKEIVKRKQKWFVERACKLGIDMDCNIF